MLKIYIARHGQNEDNANGILNGHRDLPLTALGIEQARELAEGIKGAGLTFDAVYTSPLLRAHSTAEVVCAALNIAAPIVLDLLIERDFGEMAGKRVRDIERLCAPDIVKTDTITYFLNPPGAETFPQLLQRAHRALDVVRMRHANGSVLLVMHGDLGKMVYADYYNLSWMDMLTKFHFGNGELLLLSEDSSPDEAHVIQIAQHNH